MPGEGASGVPPKPQGSLKHIFGGEIELVPDSGEPERFRIMAEFEVGGVFYVALQNEAQRAEDDIELLRVEYGDKGAPRLETIQDDEEWETAAEAYDDMQFSGNEWP